MWRGWRQGAAPPQRPLATILWWALQPPSTPRELAEDPLGVHWLLSCFFLPSAESPLPHARAAVLPSPNSLSPLKVPSRHLPPRRGKAPARQKKGIFFCHLFFINAHCSSRMSFRRTRGPWLDRSPFSWSSADIAMQSGKMSPQHWLSEHRQAVSRY